MNHRHITDAHPPYITPHARPTGLQLELLAIFAEEAAELVRELAELNRTPSLGPNAAIFEFGDLWAVAIRLACQGVLPSQRILAFEEPHHGASITADLNMMSKALLDIIQVAMKAIRFGLADRNPNAPEAGNNAEILEQAIWMVLRLAPATWFPEACEARDRKDDRLDRFLQTHAASC
jgi:hypothetical protein